MPLPTKTRGRPPVRFNPDLADKILDEVSAGPTLAEVCKKPGYPHPKTFRRWVREDEDLFTRWQVAQEMRSHSLFDESVDLARSLIYRSLKGEDMDGGRAASQNQIRAVQTAVETLKDAAAKLNPRDYGQRKVGDVVVPIQIITNMNMGQDGKAIDGTTSSVYEITVPAIQVTDVPE